MTTPNPYVIQRVNKWITVEDEASDLAGMAIKVRAAITNAERDDLITEFNAVNAYSREYIKADLKEREKLETKHGGSPRDIEWSMLAPYIIEWNIQAENANGEVAPVPAPADGGPAVFALITPEAYSWIYECVLLGYRAWGKAGIRKDE